MNKCNKLSVQVSIQLVHNYRRGIVVVLLEEEGSCDQCGAFWG